MFLMSEVVGEMWKRDLSIGDKNMMEIEVNYKKIEEFERVMEQRVVNINTTEMSTENEFNKEIGSIIIFNDKRTVIIISFTELIIKQHLKHFCIY